MRSQLGDNFSKSVPLASPTSIAGRVRATSSIKVPQTSRTNLAGINVLISDEHYKNSLGIVRHLGQMGVLVSVLAHSRNSLVCRSRYCHEVIPCLSDTVASLAETALDAVKQRQFDLILPVSYAMTLALAQCRHEFAPHTRLELVDSDTIKLAANKLRMVELAQEIGVPAPKTFWAGDALRRNHDLTFPVVIKPKNESPGHPPVRFAENFEQLRAALSPQAEETSFTDPSALLVQEYIPGSGCGFFATYQEGTCKRIFMHTRVREYPASGGISTCAESFYDSKLERHGRKMLDALDWHGVAMVEFRRDSRDGEYKLMEVNPKFWGSVDLPLAAGADFPGDLCRMALGSTLSFTDSYQRNLRFHWPFSGHGDLYHLWTRPESILDVAIDFVNPRVKSNIWLQDFGPNLKEMAGLATQLLGMGRK